MSEQPQAYAGTRSTLTRNLAEWTLQLIAEQGLGPGDGLPTAGDLAQRFGVSTPTMREALRSLQATEVVEIRHGSGIYVGPNLGRVVLPNRNAGSLSADRFGELLDARLLIEPHLTELAAANRSGQDLLRLRECLERAERSMDDDAALHAANMDFHRMIARAAGNQVLAEVVDSLLTVHGPEQRQILRIYNDRARDHEEHQHLLGVIEARDTEAARRLAAGHLSVVKDVVTGTEPE